MGHNIDDMPDAWLAEPIVYRIDWQDRIVSVNDAWTWLPIENEAPAPRAPRLLHPSIWDFVSDTSTIHLYRDLLARTRGGQAVTFPFRCDGPRVRRFQQMEMKIAPVGTALEFTTTVVRQEQRPAEMILDRRVPRAAPSVRVCSWCKRIEVNGRWAEIEDALTELAIFNRHVPDLAHGMCEDCSEWFTARRG